MANAKYVTVNRVKDYLDDGLLCLQLIGCRVVQGAVCRQYSLQGRRRVGLTALALTAFASSNRINPLFAIPSLVDGVFAF
jgi:hypothetical protein